MKLCDFTSSEVVRAVKMCFISSFVLAFFIYMGISHMYDVIFPVVFITYTVKYYSIED